MISREKNDTIFVLDVMISRNGPLFWMSGYESS